MRKSLNYTKRGLAIVAQYNSKVNHKLTKIMAQTNQVTKEPN